MQEQDRRLWTGPADRRDPQVRAVDGQVVKDIASDLRDLGHAVEVGKGAAGFEHGHCACFLVLHCRLGLYDGVDPGK